MTAADAEVTAEAVPRAPVILDFILFERGFHRHVVFGLHAQVGEALVVTTADDRGETNVPLTDGGRETNAERGDRDRRLLRNDFAEFAGPEEATAEFFEQAEHRAAVRRITA